MSQQPVVCCPQGQVFVCYCKFEGTWDEMSAEVGQMFSQSEALAAVTMVTRCSYHTILTPLILLQSERKELGLTLFSQEAVFHVDLSLSFSEG